MSGRSVAKHVETLSGVEFVPVTMVLLGKKVVWETKGIGILVFYK